MHGSYRAVVLSVLKELSVLPQTVTVQTFGQTSGAIQIWPGGIPYRTAGHTQINQDNSCKYHTCIGRKVGSQPSSMCTLINHQI